MSETVADRTETKTCSRCGDIGSSSFCPKCGNRMDGPVAKGIGRGKLSSVLGLTLIAALGYVTVFGVPSFTGTGSELDLSIEVSSNKGARFGFVSITNLAKEPVQIREVRINHRTDDACSDKTGWRLATGERAIVGTLQAVNGLCGGSIVRVTVLADQGEADYPINW
jgi:hypothetical protein